MSNRREGDYWCPNCKMTIFASKKNCSRCGFPKPSSTKTTTTTTTVNNPPARTGGGGGGGRAPDWTCVACNFVVWGSKTHCKCGVSRPDLAAAAAGAVGGGGGGASASTTSTTTTTTLPTNAPARRLDDWMCSCGESVFGSRPACRRCGKTSPHLVVQDEVILQIQRADANKSVQKLNDEVAAAKSVLESQKQKKGDDGVAAGGDQSREEESVQDTTSRLESLLAACTAAQERLAQTEKNSGTSSSSSLSSIRPPPYWSCSTSGDSNSLVFPSSVHRVIDISNETFERIGTTAAGGGAGGGGGGGGAAGGTNNQISFLEASQIFVDKNLESGPSCNKIRVTKISRIENDKLWISYETSKMLMSKATTAISPTPKTFITSGAGSAAEIAADPLKAWLTSASNLRRDLNEMFGWHGTSKDVASIICEQGMDERVGSLNGLFGSGCYFAENLEKSLGYVTYDKHTCYVFLSRVVMGEPAILQNKTCPNTRRPPAGKDSILGIPHSHHSAREFIVYDRRQVFPEMLLELKRV